jgi:hypothetical protein
VILLTLLSCGWLDRVDPDSPCEETAYAISRRTYECTGDGDLANARYDAFFEQFECIPLEYDEYGEVTSGPGANTGVLAEDTYHCAFTLGELACERVEELGDDLAAWLELSNACAYVIKEAGR